MVSRSLEKMMLIAVGLSTAVIVGVPVLLYAIDTVNAASEIQLAEAFAQGVHNATARVDQGIANNVTAEVLVPMGVTVSTDGTVLTVLYQRGSFQPVVWSTSYGHHIVLATAPSGKGAYSMEVKMVSSSIEIAFTPL
jgi:hypothetical protein